MDSRTRSHSPSRPLLPALAALALALASACGGPRADAAVGSTAPPKGQLTTTGTATLDVVPDMADVTMTLTIEEPKPKDAVSALRKRQAHLIAALRAAGVEDADLHLSQIRLSPVYDPNWQVSRIRGYAASITVTASTKEFDRIGDIVEGAASAGVSDLATSFRVTDLASLKKKVRELALAAARDNAAQMAHAMDVGLVRVVQLGEAPQGALWAYGSMLPNLELRADAKGAFLQPELQPLTMTVTVTYELGA